MQYYIYFLIVILSAYPFLFFIHNFNVLTNLSNLFKQNYPKYTYADQLIAENTTNEISNYIHCELYSFLQQEDYYTLPKIEIGKQCSEYSTNQDDIAIILYSSSNNTYSHYVLINSLLQLHDRNVNYENIHKVYVLNDIVNNNNTYEYFKFVFDTFPIANYQLFTFSKPIELSTKINNQINQYIIIYADNTIQYNMMLPSQIHHVYKYYKDLNHLRIEKTDHIRLVLINFLHHSNDPEWFSRIYSFSITHKPLKSYPNANITMTNFSSLSIKEKIKTMISTDVAISCFNDNLLYAVYLLPDSSLITLNPSGYEDSTIVSQLTPLGINVRQLFDYEQKNSKHLRYNDYNINLDPSISKSKSINIRYLILTIIYSSNIVRLDKFDSIPCNTTFIKK